jgi:predicted outer membrane repeat protein
MFRHVEDAFMRHTQSAAIGGQVRSQSALLLLVVSLALALLTADRAHAATFTVGTTGGCSHVNLQTAVNSAEASPGPDTIRVNSEIFTAQEVSINTAQELNIIGGHANCGVGQPTPGSRATLDGTGGNPRSVMRIIVPTGGLVRLLNLNIRKGDLTASGTEGGGIYFEGNGRLGITETTIANNVAGYGAGLYLRGTGDEATVECGTKVTVSGNTAWRSGGGVYVDQVKFSMLGADSGIFLNEAQGSDDSGYGGGLVVLAKERNAYAYIGGGLGSTGSIFNNTAKYGGGAAIVGDDGNGTTQTAAELHVYSLAAGPPASIRNNKASVQGGGIYSRGFSAGTINEDAKDASAFLWNAELRGNSAPDGAAIYADGQDNYIFGHAQILFNVDSPFSAVAPPGFACPASQFCGGILDNVAQTLEGTPTDGAVVHMVRGAYLDLGGHDNDRVLRGGLTVEGNRGGRLIHAGTEQTVRLENVLIADNQVSQPLIHVEGDSGLYLTDLTLAGNVIGSGNPALQVGDGELNLRRSILWQPGRTLLNCSGCSKTFERVIANERASLDGGSGTQVVVADPRFVDTGFGDYRLRAGSPAVDYVPAISGDDRDVLGLARDVKLPIKLGAPGGMRDIGAFERQTLQPLVLNSDMDSDVRLWPELIVGSVSRDTLNVSGTLSSGSLRVSSLDDVVAGQANRYARQCIHLPGPARYALNGWGRGGDPSGFAFLDTTQLRWELRHNGGEDCTSGTIAASGSHTLSSGNWRRPANPAVIDVPAANWTSQSSLVVYLVVVQSNDPDRNAALGWFDGITLEAEAPTDTLFRDGFE